MSHVCSARRKLKLDGNSTSNAQLAEIMEMCKKGHCSSNEPSAPEPMCILASNRQLDEMVRNCTDEQFVSLGIDPTFKLGEFCDTYCISFENVGDKATT